MGYFNNTNLLFNISCFEFSCNARNFVENVSVKEKLQMSYVDFRYQAPSYSLTCRHHLVLPANTPGANWLCGDGNDSKTMSKSSSWIAENLASIDRSRIIAQKCIFTTLYTHRPTNSPCAVFLGVPQQQEVVKLDRSL